MYRRYGHELAGAIAFVLVFLFAAALVYAYWYVFAGLAVLLAALAWLRVRANRKARAEGS